MFLLIFSLLHSLFSDAQQEKHFLHYKSTVLTKADTFPEFSAVGVCDDRQIKHFSNEERVWILTEDDWTEPPKDPPDSRDWFIHQIRTLTNCENSQCSGVVSLLGQESGVPVSILRDTGASQSLLLEGILPLSDQTTTGAHVLVRGVEMGCTVVPLHSIEIKSPLVSGRVVVGVRPYLPIEGVSFILGNDLAGVRVTSNPQVIEVPVSSGSSDLSQSFPDVFPVCAVTRAMAKQTFKSTNERGADFNFNLADTFLRESGGKEVDKDVPIEFPIVMGKEELETSQEIPPKESLITRDQLILEQSKDSSLSSLFEEMGTEQEVNELSFGYFQKNGVLMRKYTHNHYPDKMSGAMSFRLWYLRFFVQRFSS
ncbi:uncharacterized protein LOC125275920 isoform X1 [Megalobrama amblycephala]|uniref:uncharacterized protein LOC125275920 isoform X1 n=1 Tax=Megalobrama amblycephala TaxID=75352 RepID=UPI0020143C98|nr:uncharacterized protein LOC125275920 isoform X1 [Megalobrama amblycephala]